MRVRELGRGVLVATLTSVVASCGNTASDASDSGGAGSSGGSAGSGGECESAAPRALRADFRYSQAAPCSNGSKPRYGVLVDAARGCLDTSVSVEAGCSGEPSSEGGYWCVQRLSDKAKFWLWSLETPVFDAAHWQPCPCAPATPPPACFVAECERAPESLCSQENTRSEYGCGSPQSEWDADCCARKTCVDANDCAEDEICETIPTRAAHYCWPTSAGSCDCGGTLAGLDKTLCVAK